MNDKNSSLNLDITIDTLLESMNIFFVVVTELVLPPTISYCSFMLKRTSKMDSVCVSVKGRNDSF